LDKLNNLKELLNIHNLNNIEYKKITKILKREPNLLELGIYSVMWSEHCSYKSSKKWLRQLPTKSKIVICGPGENAGIIDIGGNDSIVFKIESHNHPSYLEPFQGAATGVGGILRDIFTMGARPIAILDSLRFGDIKQKKQKYLLSGVVSGISNYGNCMGIPTVGGECYFNEDYNKNILVNAMAVGVAKKNKLFFSKATGINNPVIYVGAKTGKDGIHGATMASAEFDDNSKQKKPTVQVGDPFTEKLLLEACLELFKEDLIIGIQDMGAAGLTSSSFEMAGRSGSGMKMDLDKVPSREENMTAYDFMLSESQERMLICAKKGCEQAIIDIFEKWELSVAVIGEVTDTGNMELYWHGEKCADIPIQPLSEEAPILDRPTSKPKYLDDIENISMKKELSTTDIFDKLWSSLEVVDKSFIYSQYDSMVQTNTIKGPGTLDGSVIRIKETGKALAMSADCNTRFCYIDPEKGAAAAVMEAGRNVAMTGARPLAITDCLNFGNPENPEVMWQFKYACEGIKSACKALHTPVIGGNVSLYNETNGVGIFPTPSIATVGVNDDMNNVLSSHFHEDGNYICIVGESYSEFGGSLYLKEIEGQIAGKHPKIDFNAELKLWDIIINANKLNLLEAAKDVNVGGIAIAIAKMCSVGDMGCLVDVAFEHEEDIFSESLSRAIVEIKPENIQAFNNLADELDVSYIPVGKTGGNVLSINGLYKNMDKVKNIYFNKFQEIIEQDL